MFYFSCNTYLHVLEVRTDFFIQASLVFLSENIWTRKKHFWPIQISPISDNTRLDAFCTFISHEWCGKCFGENYITWFTILYDSFGSSREGEVFFPPSVVCELMTGCHDREFGWAVCLNTWNNKKWRDICPIIVPETWKLMR